MMPSPSPELEKAAYYSLQDDRSDDELDNLSQESTLLYENGEHALDELVKAKADEWDDTPAAQPKLPSSRYKKVLAVAAVLLSGVVLGSFSTSAADSTPGQWVQDRLHRGPSKAVQNARDKALCNPYEQYGYLNVSDAVLEENRWMPLHEQCEVVDYMSKMRDAMNGSGVVDSSLEFARGKTAFIIGDSIDRDHVKYFCTHLGANLTVIDASHPLSPAYPPGQELPYEGYPHGAEWVSHDMSRPWFCYIEELDFLITNLFIYGYFKKEDAINFHPFWYPPGLAEDRVSAVGFPLLDNLARHFNRSSTPDIVSISPTFWSVSSLGWRDNWEEYWMVQNGTMTAEEAAVRFNRGRMWDPSHVYWEEHRFEEWIRRIAALWPETQPRILWRRLHHILSWESMPAYRTAAVDQVGRSVVEEIVAEAHEAADPRSWADWQDRHEPKPDWQGYFPQASAAEKLEQAQRDKLDKRLVVDNWGELMNGQEQGHFRDNIHPGPLPGGWLWGNMMLHQLHADNLTRQFELEDAARGRGWFEWAL